MSNGARREQVPRCGLGKAEEEIGSGHPGDESNAAQAVFATSAAAVLVADDAVADDALQPSFVQPALLRGEIDGLSPWTQYNPHGIFIGLENIGYALLGVAFLFLGLGLIRQPSRLERASGWVLVGGGAATVATLVIFAVVYRSALEYRFEVTAIAISWLVLIPTSVMLAVVFGRGAGGRAELRRPTRPRGGAGR